MAPGVPGSFRLRRTSTPVPAPDTLYVSWSDRLPPCGEDVVVASVAVAPLSPTADQPEVDSAPSTTLVVLFVGATGPADAAWSRTAATFCRAVYAGLSRPLFSTTP